MSVDISAAERAIRDFLRALGHDPGEDPELLDTPRRVAHAFADDLLCGYRVDVAALLAGGSPAAECTAHVLVRDLRVATLCPHHLLPSLGKATVAYGPGPRLLGLGVLAQLVDAFSRRLTLQENICQNIVQALSQHAEARGAWCRIELVHGCLSARGECQSEARVSTVAAAGDLAGPAGTATLATLLAEDET